MRKITALFWSAAWGLACGALPAQAASIADIAAHPHPVASIGVLIDTMSYLLATCYLLAALSAERDRRAASKSADPKRPGVPLSKPLTYALLSAILFALPSLLYVQPQMGFGQTGPVAESRTAPSPIRSAP